MHIRVVVMYQKFISALFGRRTQSFPTIFILDSSGQSHFFAFPSLVQLTCAEAKAFDRVLIKSLWQIFYKQWQSLTLCCALLGAFILQTVLYFNKISIFNKYPKYYISTIYLSVVDFLLNFRLYKKTRC